MAHSRDISIIACVLMHVVKDSKVNCAHWAGRTGLHPLLVHVHCRCCRGVAGAHNRERAEDKRPLASASMTPAQSLLLFHAKLTRCQNELFPGTLPD